jgi:hypothetical protein
VDLTLGGVTVGLAILVWRGVQWWNRERPGFPVLLPFLASGMYGILLILSTGGLLGEAAGVALWGSNAVGDAGLEYAVDGNTPEVTRGYSLSLSDGGHAMVLLLTVGMAAAWKFSRKLPKKDMGLGVLCGISLGLADGVAGWAADILAPVANGGGDWITGVM